MTDKPIKIPGPDHPIAIAPTAGRVVVTVAGKVAADSKEALTLREADYPPVQYIPMKDVDASLLVPTSHYTYCPYKGDCSYYSIPAGGARRPTMPCGSTRHRTRPWPRSRTTSPSIPTASTRSNSGNPCGKFRHSWRNTGVFSAKLLSRRAPSAMKRVSSSARAWSASVSAARLHREMFGDGAKCERGEEGQAAYDHDRADHQRDE